MPLSWIRACKTPCVLHVGMAKTGSTALQEYLTRIRNIPAAGKAFHYGTISAGGYLELNAHEQPVLSVRNLHDLSPILLKRIGKQLRACNRRLGIPILSHEAWWSMARAFAERLTFEHLKVEIRVVVYIRPPVEWFNSAFWQFLMFQGFDTLSDKLATWRSARWGQSLEHWEHHPCVERLDVRLYDADVIPDFLQTIGAEPPTETERRAKANPSPNLFQVKLLRLLHPAPDQADKVRRKIRRLFPCPTSRLPWALTPADTRLIIDRSREDNKKLMNLLGPEDAARMEADARWWSAEPYLDRERDDLTLSRDELQHVAHVLGQVWISS